MESQEKLLEVSTSSRYRSTVKGIVLACGHTIYRSCESPSVLLAAPCNRRDGLQSVVRYYDTGKVRKSRRGLR